ncbi:GTP cyclohydrolase 1 [Candidatus Hodgkinia cicadicola]|nr:GTP cyclohydrolase 1 [Candidatus Hodgkinia cicadicola]
MSLLIRDLIDGIGEDSSRRGLALTPQRVFDINKEIYCGYNTALPRVAKSFNASEFGVDVVYVKNMFFCSSCEHHMMPFFGVASLAYIPAGLVVGLSKVVSVLNFYSARLQSQERLTYQVFDYVKNSLRPKAIVLKLECKHMCMITRGVKSVCAATGSVISAGLFNVSRTLFANVINTLRE